MSGRHRPAVLAHDLPVGAGAQVLAVDGVALLASGALDPGAVLRRDLGGLVQPVVDVARLDVIPGSSGDSRLASEDGDGFQQGLVGCHADSRFGKLVCMVEANSLACKGRKLLCMDNLGDLVKEWRRQSGLSRPELARLIREAAEHDSPGARVQRQHIDQLEAAGSRTPRYIGDLAKAMGTRVDDLMALRMPPPLQMAHGAPRDRMTPPPLPPADFSDRHVVSATDWGILQDVKMALSERELFDIHERASVIRQHVEELVRKRLSAGASPITSEGAETSTRRGIDTSRFADSPDLPEETLGGRSHFGALDEAVPPAQAPATAKRQRRS